MLVFDPENRIPVDQASEYPIYRRRTTWKTKLLQTVFFCFDFEKEDLTESRLKELIDDEYVCVVDLPPELDPRLFTSLYRREIRALS